jgi:hypothetical protein
MSGCRSTRLLAAAREFSSSCLAVVVAATIPQILLHLSDCPRYGVSVIAPRGLQISSLDKLGDHLSGGRVIGRPNDVAHETEFLSF